MLNPKLEISRSAGAPATKSWITLCSIALVMSCPCTLQKDFPLSINFGVICLRKIGNGAIKDPSWTNARWLNGRGLDKLLLTVN